MRRKRNLTKKEWAVLIAVLLLWLVITQVFGIGSSGSGLRVGWLDTSSGTHIKASYLLFTGHRQYQKNLGDNQEIRIEITTEAGSLNLDIRDAHGLVFSEQNLQSGNYTVMASGRISVILTGAEHKGSFYLTWDKTG